MADRCCSYSIRVTYRVHFPQEYPISQYTYNYYGYDSLSNEEIIHNAARYFKRFFLRNRGKSIGNILNIELMGRRILN